MHATSDARTKRLLDLVVLLLDARRPIAYAELREQFGEYRTAKPDAGIRAFERDKATLLEMGVPLRWVPAEESPEAQGEGGYVIDRKSYRLPEITLQPDEVAILVATAAAARNQTDFPYRHAAELAVRKLTFDLAGMANARRNRRARQAAQSSQSPPMPFADVLVHLPTTYKSGSLGENLELLETAVHNRKRVTFQYDGHKPSSMDFSNGSDSVAASTTGTATSASSGEFDNEKSGPSEREVDPYGLVYRHGAWLLVGNCHRAQGLRRFRVDRISKLTVAPKPRTPDFEVPADFSLKEQGVISPWRFEREPPVRTRLFVSATLRWVAEEDFGPAARTEVASENPDEAGTIVEFDCKNPGYLVTRVLSAAGALRVLEPTSLRKRVSEVAAAIARRNAEQPAPRPDAAEARAEKA